MTDNSENNKYETELKEGSLVFIQPWMLKDLFEVEFTKLPENTSHSKLLSDHQKLSEESFNNGL